VPDGEGPSERSVPQQPEADAKAKTGRENFQILKNACGALPSGQSSNLHKLSASASIALTQKMMSASKPNHIGLVGIRNFATVVVASHDGTETSNPSQNVVDGRFVVHRWRSPSRNGRQFFRWVSGRAGDGTLEVRDC
jgi:hypothetical protein